MILFLFILSLQRGFASDLSTETRVCIGHLHPVCYALTKEASSPNFSIATVRRGINYQSHNLTPKNVDQLNSLISKVEKQQSDSRECQRPIVIEKYDSKQLKSANSYCLRDALVNEVQQTFGKLSF